MALPPFPQCFQKLPRQMTPVDELAFNWPGPVDRLAVAAFLLITMGLPLAGYVLLALDIRSYLRSLRRQLVKIAGGYTGLPAWVLDENPRCLSALGLRLPCGEEELKAAYRYRVKRLHPDRGGDQQQFLRLQCHFEQALQVVRDFEARTLAGRSSTKRAPSTSPSKA